MQSNLFVTLSKSSMVIFTLLLVVAPNGADGKQPDKADAYKRSQLKTAISTHGDKFQQKKKVRQLNPLPFLKRPSLDGNYYHRQQYQAVEKRLKTHATPDAQSPQN